MRYLHIRLLCALLLLLTASLSLAQEATPPVENDAEPLTVSVFVDSAFLRALPTQEAEPSSSVFENDVLQVIGRNADGTWFQVKRFNRDEAAGWISRRVVSFMFEVAELPITDFETGLTGETPVFDSGVAAFILTEASLRAAPSRDAERVGVVPILTTIPIVERSPDSLWLFVNYNGQTGWVAEFLTNISGDVNDLPVAAIFGIEYDVINLPIIPVEVQIAQVNRMRDFILPKQEVSAGLAGFWAVVRVGENAPCNPPPGDYPIFPRTQQDIYELPEIRRYTRQLDTAINDLNESIAMMQRCGVYTAEEIGQAYSRAVNATNIFEVTLDTLQNLEENVILRSP